MPETTSSPAPATRPQLAAALGAGISLGDRQTTIIGLGDTNLQRALTAIQHASGRRPANPEQP